MDNGDQLLDVLAALANPHRLRILAVLHGGTTHVSQLARDVGILAAMAVAALSLTVLTVARRQQLSVKDLHPPLVAP